MPRQLYRLNQVSTLSMLALVACQESTTPTGPPESLSPARASAAGYSAQDLGLGGEFATTAMGINAAGHVVGYVFDPDDTFRGFIWKDGVITRIGSSLGGRDARAFDINNAGQVVGSAANAAGAMHAFRWTKGVMKDLGTLGGTASFAYAINSRGDVVGESALPGDNRSGAFLVKNGVMTDLGTLGGANSTALDINEAGQVVGWSETATGARHPFLWEKGVMKDLLSPGSASNGMAFAIDASGTVVGETDSRAFQWRRGVISNLGLEGYAFSIARGIRAGRIVGTVENRAFVLVNGVLTVLPLLPDGVFTTAFDVNAAGVVVGHTTKDLAPDPSCGGVCAGFDVVTMWR